MHRDDEDEEEERKRQARERKGMSALDRIYGRKAGLTISGGQDKRFRRRTGRVAQLPIRVQLRVQAIVEAILNRDGLPSVVVFFEEALDAYQQVHGAVDESLIPSEEELVTRFEAERDRRYAERKRK